MEWDSWPNEGYPCSGCGQRFECSTSCVVRENAPLVKNYCEECHMELPGRLATSPARKGCSKLLRRAA